ncbi:adenosylcobalamin-dependent ribonucleoside-diphosphate reductase [Vulcanisaeta souniana]|uniref:Vitamin B12-dependent ribonucleotide reductase n=1 Tax=Vulcanisaeta souniana JCM 11219 TaxID=1293586 RepID=A0A830E666_9CREN|nr:adenosylcobalamin-dependent ribonucleoside-diphosphate reductase [Vulcanisaeta souniana]BDR93133.1 ribonucleoside-diphosphate reductase, adenosylcobalamin-dependent [Vulcanisaeta souniana JCM 11219]GGI87052.1 ribonucleoside-diphosphate reductase, adenosylcobalamin-dependent [Vulcanisaeta souniana JCM 11219]
MSLSTEAVSKVVGIKILKRNGTTEDFSRDKLVRSLKLAGAPDPDLVIKVLNIKGTVPSSELSDRVQLIMLNMVTDDLRWHDAARNYLLWSVYKQVWGKDVVKAINDGRAKFEDAYREGFRTWFRAGLEHRIWDSEMSAWYAQHIDELAKYLDPSRDLLLTYNGVRTLMSRYLLKRLDGTFFETPQYLWMRTAMGVAYAELKYGGDPITWSRRFYDLMSQLKLMPNSPTLYNAMTRLGQLSACFVVPIDDCLSRESDTNREDPECNFGIMDALRLAALIFQSGGGVGYNFGKLRPEGDIVRSTTGIASGPLSFMKLFDTLVDTIKQGGKRRGAQMGMLFWWHPDIERFITSKSGELKDVQLQNFNISVAIDDYFMQKALKGEDVYLVNPRECPCLYKTWGEEFVKCYEGCVEAIKAGKIRIWRRINAKELWDKIVKSAWDSGDPGLWNRDLANYINNEKLPGEVINATNPCSEESLYDFESCNLGSINLVKYVYDGRIDWDSLARDVQLAVRFLDDVIDVNKLPHDRLRKRVLETRRIGLGTNGLADTLIALGLRYDSPQALAVSNELASFIARMAVRASIELAREKGAYPAYKHGDWAEGVLPWTKHRERLEKFSSTVDKNSVEEYLKVLDAGYNDPRVRSVIDGATAVLRGYRALDGELSIDVSTIGIRNGSIMSIAPEGSRSLIAGVNSSIEPLFAIAYIRNLSIGKLIEYNYTALRLLMVTKTLDGVTRRFVEEYGILPRDHPLANLLRTAHEIHWKWHVYMQVTWAKWNDSGVSKTINMPSDTPIEDVEQAYRLAWLLNAFGITVYRDKSKSVQVIYTGVKSAETKPVVEAKVESRPKIEARVSYTSLSSLKDKLVRIKGNGESIEEEMQEELGETDDPYCKTGSCG